jgi:hypothetical protein
MQAVWALCIVLKRAIVEKEEEEEDKNVENIFKGNNDKFSSHECVSFRRNLNLHKA